MVSVSLRKPQAAVPPANQTVHRETVGFVRKWAATRAGAFAEALPGCPKSPCLKDVP